jgi:hypothetical protein
MGGRDSRTRPDVLGYRAEERPLKKQKTKEKKLFPGKEMLTL